jgi:predicted DCC family thiol-disulfide oxidoreductase YuxK
VHGAVKFVIRHDHSGTKFRFAPLQGETFQKRVPEHQRNGIPDSIVVQTCDGPLLVRSDAFVHIMRRLGGKWSVLASLLGICPRTLRDAIYDFIARIRYNVFGRRDDLCPVIPRDLAQRFDP